VSFSSTIYEQLLHLKIPNAQKRQSSHQCLFALLGATRINAAGRMFMKLTPGYEIRRKLREQLQKFCIKNAKKIGLIVIIYEVTK